MLGDMEYVAPHRLTCDVFSKGVDTYCYLFDALPSFADPRLGVIHASDLPLTFYNLAGTGYTKSPFHGKTEAYFALADQISRSLIGFISELDPNAAFVSGSQVAKWTKYDPVRPMIYHFKEQERSDMEYGDTRKHAIDYIQQILAPILGK